MTGETCAESGCPIVLPPYPDEEGTYWCAEHYDGPEDFEHLEEIDPEYAEERRELYND